MAASTTPGRPATIPPMPSTSSAIRTALYSTSRLTAGTAPGANRREKGKKASGGRESFYDLRSAENSLRQSEGILWTIAENDLRIQAAAFIGYSVAWLLAMSSRMSATISGGCTTFLANQFFAVPSVKPGTVDSQEKNADTAS